MNNVALLFGPSGSGKSTLADLLSEKITCTVIRQDDYSTFQYEMKEGFKSREDPKFYDLEKMYEHMRLIEKGIGIPNAPKNLKIHGKGKEDCLTTQKLVPTPLVIAE